MAGGSFSSAVDRFVLVVVLVPPFVFFVRFFPFEFFPLSTFPFELCQGN